MVLTRRQFKVCSLWLFGNLTQKEIAARFGMRREHVSHMIARARKRFPNLPKRRKRGVRTLAFSQIARNASSDPFDAETI